MIVEVGQGQPLPPPLRAPPDTSGAQSRHADLPIGVGASGSCSAAHRNALHGCLLQAAESHAAAEQRIARIATAVTVAFAAGVPARDGYPGRMTTMVSGNTLAQTGALIGDPARANILLALMDGRALTAGELAWHAGRQRPDDQRASGQAGGGAAGRGRAAGAAPLPPAGLGRGRRAVEAVSALAAIGPARHRPTGPRDEALRAARTCYDHLAGRLAVALADGLCARGHL